MIEIIKYIFLGLIQGIAEILPISSSGHIMFYSKVFNIETPGLTFELFTNFASFLALFIVLWKDIKLLIANSFTYLFKKKEENKVYFHYLLKLAIGVIFIGIIGFIFKDKLNELKSLLFIGFGFLITASFLLLTFYVNKTEDKEEITFLDSVVIGVIQVFSLLPGISRSGSTIVGGKSRKISLSEILKFSFLMYLVISVPTTILGVNDVLNNLENINVIGYTLAFIVTFSATLVTGIFVLKRLKMNHLVYFSIYLFIMAILSFTIYLLN